MKKEHHQLWKIREGLSYSQEEMADKLGMSQANYNRIENDKQGLKMEHIPLIIEATGKSKEDIITTLHGISVQNSINDHAKESQNIVNIMDKEMVQALLAEKDRVIRLLEQQIDNLNLQLAKYQG